MSDRVSLATNTKTFKPPFPYFGGKSKVAGLVWDRLGDVRNYVEPFFGSGAVLLRRPDPFGGTETINDACGYVANFWRAVQADPEAVDFYSDQPVNENDLHARHSWLIRQENEIVDRLEGDPEWFDAKIAGWWCWGLCCWIGSGWCSGNGPWQSVEDDDGIRRLIKAEGGKGASRQLPRLGSTGRGVNRKRPHLSDAGQGVNRQLPHLGSAGQGVNRQLPHLGSAGQGRNRGLFQALSDRLRDVRVCSGDWARVTGSSVTTKHGLTGVFLDPPYADTAKRDTTLYRKDSLSVAHDVRVWAIEHGDDPKMRIALCGYEGEHVMPETWECVLWKASGGYASQSSKDNVNCRKERIWFSPHCLIPAERRTKEQS